MQWNAPKAFFKSERVPLSFRYSLMCMAIWRIYIKCAYARCTSKASLLHSSLILTCPVFKSRFINSNALQLTTIVHAHRVQCTRIWRVDNIQAAQHFIAWLCDLVGGCAGALVRPFCSYFDFAIYPFCALSTFSNGLHINRAFGWWLILNVVQLESHPIYMHVVCQPLR